MNAIGPVKDVHLESILRLNNIHAQETSELDEDALRDLVGASFASFEAKGGEAGFLIAMSETSDYTSPNFLWFQERYPRFVYVDRIIVSADHRGHGYARQFYELLFERARAEGYSVVTCEVNVDPPNPASDAFHDRMGFTEAGRAKLAHNGKTVRYLMKDLNQ